MKLDHVEIAVDDEEIVKRISGRRVHEASGRVYHVEHNPPKVAGVDDETSDALIRRADDSEETVRKRLALYHEQTKPLVDFYSRLAAVEQTPSGKVEVWVRGGRDHCEGSGCAQLSRSVCHATARLRAVVVYHLRPC